VENRLKEIRESLGMTQEQLSEKADVSRTIISGIESGRVEVTTTGTLIKLAIALNKPVSDVFFVQ